MVGGVKIRWCTQCPSFELFAFECHGVYNQNVHNVN